jgi:dTDP-4-dehydrorhamnose reductase
LAKALSTLQAGQQFIAADDTVVSPTYVPDLVNASLDYLIDRENGVWHLAYVGAMAWLEFARAGAKAANVPVINLTGAATDVFKFPARRPPYSALTSERGLVLPGCESAIHRFSDHVYGRSRYFPDTI